jgi:hypothetical protein
LQPRKTPVLPVVCILVGYILIAFLQVRIDPLKKQYEPGQGRYGDAARHLPVEFAIGALTGFREAIAGLLWVRTDDFFHDGDYKSIPPLVRIVTWLDPHNIDVFQTGAWHMDYNFTDTQERSDRRYIPLSIALLREGIAENPDSPELESDLGFTHFYRKIGDYPAAGLVFQQGQDTINRLEADAAAHPNDPNKQTVSQNAAIQIVTIGHGLAHAYEACGQIDKALAEWRYCIAQHKANMAQPWGKSTAELWSYRIASKQYEEMQMRQVWRSHLPAQPIDVGFQVQLKRIAPKVFICSGHLHIIGSAQDGPNKFFLEQKTPVTWTPIDGARVEIRLQDQGYKMPTLRAVDLSNLNLDLDTTIMQDSIAVRDDMFSKKIDMSQDPDFYSFTKPTYEVTVWFNPCNPLDASPSIQDRLGWLGQGMTDKHYLDTSGVIPGDTTAPIPGDRMVKKTFILTRDDIMGSTEKVFN